MYLKNKVPFDFVVTCRISNLKFMDWFVRENVQNEDIIEDWLINGIPDCCTDKIYNDIAVKREKYDDVVSVFGAVIKRRE